MHVLGRLRHHHVHHVVVGDDADQPVLGVDDRHGQQVVARHFLGDFLAVVGDAHGQRLRVHQVADKRLPRRQDQVAQRHHAQQLPLVIDDVDVVDRLAVGCLQRRRSSACSTVMLAGSQA